ncbi:hypothetical protein GUITHDRAFT_164576 [Guillardia theta CCMP2712]|uniref:Phosphodiesterase n=1 Tax=Guillardia theta (strain CCMP2712) TaxID=905079 RepID=L1IXT4_GUITC|nr:hypothetical protein GUITHDRAFT_164576 [Guillardia theta CCMP2712]EKX40897.1 hypothetical protein GUITHDRAFT_164576 [Guillardia theta CCMP2712]|eukprot:XP_005827877.1 hypothetical protein GUITHDRAFT_164576 [Guillardia theta CCMP2712]
MKLDNSNIDERMNGMQARTINAPVPQESGKKDMIQEAASLLQEQRKKLSRLQDTLQGKHSNQGVSATMLTKKLQELDLEVIGDGLVLSRKSSTENLSTESTPTAVYSSITAGQWSRTNSSANGLEASSKPNKLNDICGAFLKRAESVPEPEPSTLLIQHGLIAEDRSPADNAAHLLNQFLQQCNCLAPLDRAIVAYSLKVLVTDPHVAAIPQGLQGFLQSQQEEISSPTRRRLIDPEECLDDKGSEKSSSMHAILSKCESMKLTANHSLKPEMLASLLEDVNNGQKPTPEVMNWVSKVADPKDENKGANGKSKSEVNKFAKAARMCMLFYRCRGTIETLYDKVVEKNKSNLTRAQISQILKELKDGEDPMISDVESVWEEAKKAGGDNLTKEQLVEAIAMWYSEGREEKPIAGTKDVTSAADKGVREWILSHFTSVASSTRRKTPRSQEEMFGLPAPAVWTLEQEVEIAKSMKGIATWSWDPFDLHEKTGGHALQALGLHVFQQWELLAEYNIDTDTMKRWLSFVEKQYADVPYHNSLHATDVLQTVNFMLQSAKLSQFVNRFQLLAILIAAIVHDLGHDGYNNNYHKHAITERAMAHNDQSIQENFHLHKLFSSMDAYPSINIFENFELETFWEMRRMIIDLILHTDMSRHFLLMKEIKEKLETRQEGSAAYRESSELLMRAVLHICDISNPAKPRELALRWTERCMAEFFRQGDKEKELQLPVSPQCDRETTFIPASQLCPQGDNDFLLPIHLILLVLELPPNLLQLLQGPALLPPRLPPLVLLAYH